MKRFKKIGLILVGIGLLAQIPFAYHRYQIGKLAERISTMKSTAAPADEGRFKDYPGVLHVHTSLGGHSTATIEDLVKGAQGLAFVVITEHAEPFFDTSAMTLNGVHNGILFVGGNEVSTKSLDRLLLIPGWADATEWRSMETPDFLAVYQKQKQLAFVAYPEKFTNWDSTFSGVEIFNLNESTKAVNKVRLFFEILWAYHKYPELTLATRFSRPDFNLRKFDEAASKRKVSLIAGSDAHSNIGFFLFGDETGNKILKMKFDEYAMIFRIMKTHVLLDKSTELTRESLLNALRQGRDYVAFDILGDPRGFSFVTGNSVMGDEVRFDEIAPLTVRSPLRSRIVVLRDGKKVSETSDTTEVSFKPTECGAYRVEVFLDTLGHPFDQLPWIISNPIFVVP